MEELKELIIEMVRNIDNQGVIKFLYDFINAFKEKWGV